MGFLKTGVVLTPIIAAGCYEPTLLDCTLTCSFASDCADGQVCGDDHFCAAPGIAGHCSSLPADASSNDRDAGLDAPTIDAPTHVALTISIEGEGRVTVNGNATCDKQGSQNGMCLISVPIDLATTVAAESYPDSHFDKWTTAVCITVPITLCTFTPSSATAVGVKFKKDG